MLFRINIVLAAALFGPAVAWNIVASFNLKGDCLGECIAQSFNESMHAVFATPVGLSCAGVLVAVVLFLCLKTPPRYTKTGRRVAAVAERIRLSLKAAGVQPAPDVTTCATRELGFSVTISDGASYRRVVVRWEELQTGLPEWSVAEMDSASAGRREHIVDDAEAADLAADVWLGQVSLRKG